MKAGRAIAAMVAALAFDAPFAAPAQEPVAATAVDLVERAVELDGRVVELTGEAIGQVMRRGAMAWVNVEDPGGAVGVWLDADSAGSIRHLGSYATRGDELRVTGTFHRSCDAHGGLLDIHASAVEVVRYGRGVPHPVDVRRVVIAAVLTLAAVVALAVLRRRDRARHATGSRQMDSLSEGPDGN